MKCKQLTKSGTNCKANAIIGSDFCFSHNPSTRERHHEATVKGGRKPSNSSLHQLDTLDLSSPGMILHLIADTINRTRQVDINGSLDVRRANAIAILSGKLLEAHKFVKFEDRVKELERVVKRDKIKEPEYTDEELAIELNEALDEILKEEKAKDN